MNCREFVDFLMRFLDDELSAEEKAVFQQHMGDCPPCAEYLKTYEKTISIGLSVCYCLDDDIPEDVPDKLVKAILEARKSI